MHQRVDDVLQDALMLVHHLSYDNRTEAFTHLWRLPFESTSAGVWLGPEMLVEVNQRD